MIRKINLRFGISGTLNPLTVPLTPVTVFVGPNNSGKSRALTEIHQYCQTGGENAGSLILAGALLEPFSDKEATQIVAAMQVTPRPHEQHKSKQRIFQVRQERFQLVPEDLFSALAHPDNNPRATCGWFLRFHTSILDGRSRMSLINPVSAGDLLESGADSLQVLFRRDDLRHQLRNKLYDAFGLYFTVDPTSVGNLRIKFSKDKPPSDEIERGWGAASVEFHSKSTDIQTFSDGVKAFTGILMTVMAGDPYVLLIDEPEAFLHPALAFKLDQNIAETTIGSRKRVFVATHSSDFVMGCIQSGAPINIVRLTYRSNVATARLLPSEKLLSLMRNPLLRSTGVLAGLFYEFVVVSEADADRAFYHEINARLNVLSPSEGVPNALFVNAQNRQTICQIIKPLRELGIPAVAIVDIDVLKEGGTVLTQLLSAAFVPPIDQQALATARAQIKRAFDSTGRDMTREGGLRLLAVADAEAARNFIANLAEYGIFVVPNGALESWLPELGNGTSKSAWLTTVFERMGEDPGNPSYVRPATGDVWDFIRAVSRWLLNPNRRGIPS